MTMSELIVSLVLCAMLQYALNHYFHGFYIKCALKFFRRIILLGDLNYRLHLSYETTHELISKQDWDGLFKMDQVI
jgi:hypothetical protein